MEIRAVAFDIDGTLYPYRRMYTHSLWFFLRRIRFLSHFSRMRRRIRTIRPIEDFRGTQAKLLSDIMAVTIERAREKIDRIVYRLWERSFRRIRPFSHLKALLQRLKNDGVPLGVLSDFPIGQKLSYLDLEGLWDCELSAEDSGYLKPNPEPFIKLAECLGISLENILYVGNNYNYDIIGAHRVGMATAHFSRHPADESVADLTFSDYRHLEEKLQKVVAS